MDRFGSNKEGLILISFVLWLTYMGGSAVLHPYPPQLTKGDQALYLPTIGADGGNWLRLAEKLASIGIITLVHCAGGYQVTLVGCHAVVVFAVLKYLKRVLRKGFVALAIQRIDDSL
jgi:hypothetical protein